MNAELEENKELAQNRHCELEKLRQDFEEVTSQNEKLKVGDTALRGSEIKLLADHLTFMKRNIKHHNLRGKRKIEVLLLYLFGYIVT